MSVRNLIGPVMIDYLLGKHHRTLPSGVILEVNGVGYSVETPLSTLSCLSPEGSDLELYIHTHVREDSIRLFGFASLEEKVVFGLLLSMSGVGPKVALAMLSTLGVQGIYQAASKEEEDCLTLVPGIGARLAEKIIVELKPKLGKLRNPVDHPAKFSLEQEHQTGVNKLERGSAFQDLEDGLKNLGFKSKVVAPLVDKLAKEMPQEGLQVLLKKALGELSGKPKKASSSKELSSIF